MIKLFRKIRFDLMEQNKSTRYLKYAIGEIILVVIGILIALQINNWNDKRINKQKETQLLKELHNEFVANKKQFDSVSFIHHRSFKSAVYLKEKLPINISKINMDSLAHHIHYMGWYYTFDPSRGVTNALMNSSTFNLISNDELRRLLISWNDVVTDYQEEELVARDNYHNVLKPFEKAHFYWDQPDKLLKDERLDLGILESYEFDNYVLDRHNDLYNIVKNHEMDLVKQTIDKIISQSKPIDND